MQNDKPYWIAFSVFPGIGPVRFKLLLTYFGSAYEAWHASPEDLRNIKLGVKLTDDFVRFRESFSVSGYLQRLSEEHVSVLTLAEDHYPKLLRQIPDAPFVLYVKGKKSSGTWDLNRSIGVVGTRKMSAYGESVTRTLTQDLLAQGFTIVSGMAYGVDAIAHATALETGGKTIAVLGCGIDIIAPPSNASLYHAIADGGGAVISEMPLGLRPNRGLFPARNRIISGLSLGVLVTEGADDSGALITARYAAEQGRDVFAVPGPITSQTSRGPAKLLKNGAKLVENVDDILAELNLDKTSVPKRPAAVGETELERKILSVLDRGHVYIDEIARSTKTPITDVTTTISLLEVKGLIKDYGGKEYGLV